MRGVVGGTFWKHFGMKDGSERLYALGDPRPGATETCTVERPDPALCNRPRCNPPDAVLEALGFRRGTLETVAAGFHQDDVRIESLEIVPAHLDGTLARDPGQAAAAGQRYHLGNPVAGDEWRIEPFEQKHPRKRTTGHRGGDCVDATSQRGGTLLAFARRTGSDAHDLYRRNDILDRVRVQGEDARRTGKALGDLTDRRGGHRAHLADRLRQHQIRTERAEHPGIHLVDATV